VVEVAEVVAIAAARQAASSAKVTARRGIVPSARGRCDGVCCALLATRRHSYYTQGDSLDAEYDTNMITTVPP
jgi:hypothetical protein